jgi:hypothetical protein
MGLNIKILFLLLALISTTSVFADRTYDSEDFNRISSVEVEEVLVDPIGFTRYELMATENFKANKINNPIENIGRVIAIGKDVVALGETVYQLVIKGKPSTKTTYAPISVIPRINGVPADIFDTEGWTAPVKRTYQIRYNNLYNVTVVHFMFSVIYSYNGSYDGKGAYLTAVQVVPEYVKSLWGWDFSATMRLGGIQNQGTRANPVAGATVMIEYTASSVLENVQRVNSFFLTGKGYFKFL